MPYLLTQMFLYLLATFALGLLLGWLLWRYGSAGAVDVVDLKDELAEARAKLRESQSEASAGRDTAIALQARLKTCEARCAELEGAKG
ncbi:MAG: hypothetical protein AAFV38_10940 [Pseudomonadota bacterium]